jgi:hypothetical protein
LILSINILGFNIKIRKKKKKKMTYINIFNFPNKLLINIFN